jgi:hypothetical protein
MSKKKPSLSPNGQALLRWAEVSCLAEVAHQHLWEFTTH